MKITVSSLARAPCGSHCWRYHIFGCSIHSAVCTTICPALMNRSIFFLCPQIWLKCFQCCESILLGMPLENSLNLFKHPHFGICSLLLFTKQFNPPLGTSSLLSFRSLWLHQEIGLVKYHGGQWWCYGGCFVSFTTASHHKVPCQEFVRN